MGILSRHANWQGDFGAMVGGNAPILVDKENGDVVVTGTGKDIDFYIEEYVKMKADNNK